MKPKYTEYQLIEVIPSALEDAANTILGEPIVHQYNNEVNQVLYEQEKVRFIELYSLRNPEHILVIND